MHQATFSSLTKAEQALVAQAERKDLASLSEDELLDLHARVRRARDKHVGIHRRDMAAQVQAKGARGEASAPPRRSASKAEVFEGALARVSRAVAAAASRHAADLRAERIAAARGGGRRAAATAPGTGRAAASTPSTKARRRSPVEQKVVASTRSAGAKRQAKRDAR